MVRRTRVMVLALMCFAALATRAPAQALRNQDIVAMKRASLGDDLIVIAIEHSPGRFTTTPEALIALKNAGVGDSVIAAMLRVTGAQGALPDAPPPDRRNAGRALGLDDQPGLKLVAGDVLGRQQRMQKASVILIGPSALRSMIPGLPRTATSVFPGPRAVLRVATPTPTFEAAWPLTQPVQGALFLYRLDTLPGERDLKRRLDSAAGTWRTDQDRNRIPLAVEIRPPDVASAPVAGAPTLARYRVHPQVPLPPGEYALLLGLANDYYDFGIDR